MELINLFGNIWLMSGLLLFSYSLYWLGYPTQSQFKRKTRFWFLAFVLLACFARCYLQPLKKSVSFYTRRRELRTLLQISCMLMSFSRRPLSRLQWNPVNWFFSFLGDVKVLSVSNCPHDKHASYEENEFYRVNFFWLPFPSKLLRKYTG